MAKIPGSANQTRDLKLHRAPSLGGLSLGHPLGVLEKHFVIVQLNYIVVHLCHPIFI